MNAVGIVGLIVKSKASSNRSPIGKVFSPPFKNQNTTDNINSLVETHPSIAND